MSDLAALTSVVEAMIAFEAVLTPTRPDDMATFVKERVRLAQATNLFLETQRAHVADPIAGIVRDMDATVSRQMYAAFAALRARYSAHIRTWDNHAIAASWPLYRRDCLTLIREMRALLDRRAAATRVAA